MLRVLPPSKQRQLLSIVAHDCLALGHIETARFALEKKVALPPGDDAETAANRVYEGATLILTDQFASGLTALNSADRSKLTKRDRELANAVGVLADAILETATVPDGDEKEPGQSSTGDSPKVESNGDNREVVRKGHDLVNTVDQYFAELDR